MSSFKQSFSSPNSSKKRKNMIEQPIYWLLSIVLCGIKASDSYTQWDLFDIYWKTFWVAHFSQVWMECSSIIRINNTNQIDIDWLQLFISIGPIEIHNSEKCTCQSFFSSTYFDLFSLDNNDLTSILFTNRLTIAIQTGFVLQNHCENSIIFFTRKLIIGFSRFDRIAMFYIDSFYGSNRYNVIIYGEHWKCEKLQQS